MIEAVGGRANHEFSADHFIDDIAEVSRTDNEIPDPEKDIGRECYAFSEQEDRAFEVAERTARGILRRFEEGRDYRIEKDALGNTFITFVGKDESLPPFMSHSHLDSVDNGGKYDGVAGVSTAFDVLADLAKADAKPTRSYRIGIFRSEESSPRNGVGCLGSSIATGTIDAARLERIQYKPGVPLSEHLSARWGDILQEVQHPAITAENTSGSVELHIEQSSLIAMNDSGMAIVTGGIGGAWRERVDKSPVASEIVTTELGMYKKLTLEFRGVSDHTGGTPPNPSFFRDGPLYRKDALVASSLFVNTLLRDKTLKLLRSETAKDTGFTSVPSHQIVELLIPVAKMSDVENQTGILRAETQEKLGVDLSHKAEEYSESSASVVSTSEVRRYLNVPAIVSALSTKAFSKEEADFGTTRATIVDYHLTPESISYKLDMREVNFDDRDKLLGSIKKRVEKTLGPDAQKYVSHKEHQPIDARLAGKLEAIAQRRGIPFIRMPSLPGHDSDRLAAAGIPVAMVFVRQNDGISHNPKENMDQKHFEDAKDVAKEFTLEMLQG